MDSAKLPSECKRWKQLLEAREPFDEVQIIAEMARIEERDLEKNVLSKSNNVCSGSAMPIGFTSWAQSFQPASIRRFGL